MHVSQDSKLNVLFIHGIGIGKLDPLGHYHIAHAHKPTIILLLFITYSRLAAAVPNLTLRLSVSNPATSQLSLTYLP